MCEIVRLLHFLFDQMRHPTPSEHFTHPLDEEYERKLQPSLWD